MSVAEDQKKIPVGFRFDPELEQILQRVSDRSAIKKTVLVEQALTYYLGDSTDPMLLRRRDFVLGVVADLIREGQMPERFAPDAGGGRRSPGTAAASSPAAAAPHLGEQAAQALQGVDFDQLAATVSPAKAASSMSAKKASKGPGAAAKHTQGMIAAQLRRRSSAQ